MHRIGPRVTAYQKPQTTHKPSGCKHQLCPTQNHIRGSGLQETTSGRAFPPRPPSGEPSSGWKGLWSGWGSLSALTYNPQSCYLNSWISYHFLVLARPPVGTKKNKKEKKKTPCLLKANKGLLVELLEAQWIKANFLWFTNCDKYFSQT